MEFHQTIVVKKEEHMATILLNRPQRFNAVTIAMLQELLAAMEEVDRYKEIRVLVITGAGKAFCAGGDVKAEEGADRMFTSQRPEEIRQTLRQEVQSVIRKLRSLNIPTIAMVNGVAVGVGFDLALACDLRVGSENCRFRVGFTSLGLIPGGGGTWFLPRIIGVPKAAELLYTDSFVEAKEAERLGLLNRLVAAEELEKETMSLARKIAQGPPLAVQLAKLHLYQGLKIDLDTALEFIATTQPICVMSEDHKEGIAALREKREAKFEGK